MIDFLVFVDTAVLVTVALLVWGLVNGINEMRVRLDQVERKRGLAVPQPWKVRYRKPGQRTDTVVMLTASNEGDAVRQCLQRKIDPKHIRSLVQTDTDGPSAA